VYKTCSLLAVLTVVACCVLSRWSKYSIKWPAHNCRTWNTGRLSRNWCVFSISWFRRL